MKALIFVFSGLLVILYIIGWIICVVKFINCDFAPVGKAEIVYGIGACTSLGGILGWFNFGK